MPWVQCCTNHQLCDVLPTSTVVNLAAMFGVGALISVEEQFRQNSPSILEGKRTCIPGRVYCTIMYSPTPSFQRVDLEFDSKKKFHDSA